MSMKFTAAVLLLATTAAWAFPTMSFAFSNSDRNKNVDKNFVRDDKHGVVLDKRRRLVYYDANATEPMDFAQAQKFCRHLKWDGRTDWRVPTKEEMRSLLELSRRGEPTIKHAFKNVKEAIYWSSTQSNYAKAWYFDFDLGRYGKRKTSAKYRVFCVRQAR